MPGKSDAFELELLRLIFNATPIANMADNASTGPLTNVFIALHTADPLAGATEVGLQNAAEANYTGYARVPVVRTALGWTCATTSGISRARPVDAITFGACTGGSSAISHFSVGVAASGSSKVLYAGAVSPVITVTAGITPQLTTVTSISED